MLADRGAVAVHCTITEARMGRCPAAVDALAHFLLTTVLPAAVVLALVMLAIVINEKRTDTSRAGIEPPPGVKPGERCPECGYYVWPAACRCVVAVRRQDEAAGRPWSV
jgi:hypothetical protein